MEVFTRKVIEVIQSIPSGKVMTYGQVAACAGSPRSARQVARILHSMSNKYDLPWHRVINAQGGISLRAKENHIGQEELLQSEGVLINMNGKVNLDRCQYDPEALCL